MRTSRAEPDTIALLDYLEERATTKHLSDVFAELLMRFGKLTAAQKRVDENAPQRRAS